MDFAQEIEAWTNKTKAKLRLVPREVILACAGSLITKSVVGDPLLWVTDNPPKNYIPGTFKANWRGGFGEIDYTTDDFTDPTGEVSMTNINAAIPDDPTGVFYITNSLPYAEPLENGWSTQSPPGGMVGLTVLEFDQIAAASILKVAAL